MSRILAALALSVAATTSTAQSDLTLDPIPGAQPRNVVFILSDDHRYDAMSFLGHQFAETPNMDAIASRGVHFPNAYVTTALCSPSRASILTGLYTFKHGVIDNDSRIREGIRYFPEFIQAAGYATAFVGKWHMGHMDDSPKPGFDHWVCFAGQGNYLSPSEDYTINVDGQRVPQRGYITDELTDYALDWLETQRDADQPFFLYLSHKAVHADFTPAERHKGTLQDKTFEPPRSQSEVLWRPDKPRWVRDQRNSTHGIEFPYGGKLDVEEFYKRYCETLTAVDDGIGQIVDKLQDLGVYEDTLIIYTSDNGFLFGEHGLIDKRVAYEESIRVPFVMQCPSLLPAGETVDNVVANIDFGPTILEAMGLRAPETMDGRSFLPLARGETIPWRDNFLYVYFWESYYPQTPTMFALRGDRYKYIYYHGIWDARELYDMVEDPEELNNLYYQKEYEELRGQLHKDLLETMEEAGLTSFPMTTLHLWGANARSASRGGEEAADFPESFLKF